MCVFISHSNLFFHLLLLLSVWKATVCVTCTICSFTDREVQGQYYLSKHGVNLKLTIPPGSLGDFVTNQKLASYSWKCLLIIFHRQTDICIFTWFETFPTNSPILIHILLHVDYTQHKIIIQLSDIDLFIWLFCHLFF